MLQEQIIRHSYQFPNVPYLVWLSWKIYDDGSSILSGLMVKLIYILRDDSTGCKKAGDNDFHQK